MHLFITLGDIKTIIDAFIIFENDEIESSLGWTSNSWGHIGKRIRVLFLVNMYKVFFFFFLSINMYKVDYNSYYYLLFVYHIHDGESGIRIYYYDKKVEKIINNNFDK